MCNGGQAVLVCRFLLFFVFVLGWEDKMRPVINFNTGGGNYWTVFCIVFFFLEKLCYVGRRGSFLSAVYIFPLWFSFLNCLGRGGSTECWNVRDCFIVSRNASPGQRRWECLNMRMLADPYLGWEGGMRPVIKFNTGRGNYWITVCIVPFLLYRICV
jgi:hypothetical protein